MRSVLLCKKSPQKFEGKNAHLKRGFFLSFLYVVPKKIIVVSLLIMVSSCSGSQNREESERKSEEISLDTYIEANRTQVTREQERIKEYIEEEGMDMERTGTGMWYNIADSGTGEDIRTGKVVTLDYQIHLLDGTLCYDSDETGPKEFKVGQGGVESGLEQAVLMLKKGAKAKFIMPPHLAHGLVGDDDRIPSRAIIIYDVEVLDVASP
ncbi:MAG: FKBP-type peptidyl-prolyl cis-trans isomerase [Marinilabilia sp.]